MPLTRGHIEKLHKRRADLLDTNLDLLGDMGEDRRPHAALLAELHANRHSVEALNHVFDSYANEITT